MAFDNKVDYMPNQSFSNGNGEAAHIEHKILQKRKWQVLIMTFLLILVAANAFIWSQSPVYQSQAILHFSYDKQTDLEFAELAQRQITLHQQRLKSNSVLIATAEELERNQMLVIPVQTLSEILTANASLTGRMITLTAQSNDPKSLKPVLDAWVKVYLDLIESEAQVSNTDELQASDEQLQLLEAKITEQEQVLSEFASDNNITSIERDENRVLNQVKNLGENLDLALADQAQSQALYNSLREAVNNGEAVIRPEDKPQIDATRLSLQEINAELSALSEKYTQTYLERDPAIVAQQQKAKQLQVLLEEQIKTSQDDYLLDVRRALSAAKGKVEQLNAQLVEHNQEAQNFSQNLEQFKRLDEELKALQMQAQTLKSQQVAQEVSKPFEAKVTLLESAFEPDFAIGPNYWFQTLISLVIAAVSAVLALLLYGFIVKPKSADAANNFVVIPSQSNMSVPGYMHQGQLSVAQQQSLPQNAPVQLPAAGAVSQPIRLLSVEEAKALYAVANAQGQALIGLLLTGINQDELLSLTKAHFSDNYQIVNLVGDFSRSLTIQADLASVLSKACQNLSDDQSIWTPVKTEEDFVQLVINAGHDAQLTFPEQLSLLVLRHTYLAFIASQGVRLNDIEQIAGYVAPSDLAQYRHLNHLGNQVEVEDIKTPYPFV